VRYLVTHLGAISGSARTRDFHSGFEMSDEGCADALIERRIDRQVDERRLARGDEDPARLPQLGHDQCDDIALDERGNIYVSEILRSDISVFSPDGSERIVVASRYTARLVNPTSLVCHAGVLCTANLGWNVKPAPRSVACISGFRRPHE
jgi:hypothetical protein